jgi:CYTH domain-containing protein
MHMAKEIEHKFTVKSDKYKSLATPTLYRQGYIPTTNGMTVRVRIAGEKGFITLKDKTVGMSRNEFEYEIPVADARQMLDTMCDKPQIEKYRYVISAAEQGLKWEVDEFLGDNAGLVVAEIEVPTEDTKFSLPEWIDKEVTGDKKYNNSQLCQNPYKVWKR